MKSDAREISDTGEKKKRRFDARDLAVMAEFIMDEYGKRKRDRQGIEQQWKEIDRQIAMIPDKSDRTVDGEKRMDAWLPEMELPLQAQTLEILTADTRRMIQPDSGPWFAAHCALTDTYLDRVDYQSLIAGDEAEVPSQMNQDNCDKLVQGLLMYWERQYDFGKHLDLINAEAFAYGTGMGRGRTITKDILINDAKGTHKQKIDFPVLVPRSIKNTYLDESSSAMMHEGFYIGPSTIFCHKVKHKDLVLAATRGSDDPDNPNGGWMPRFLKNVVEDKNGEVNIVEYEGDLIVPRQTVDSLYLPRVIATVVSWGEGKEAGESIIRLRFSKYPFSTYIEFPYHYENQECGYGTSPLQKGRPVQKAASDALNRLIAVAALNAEPPVGFDADDLNFAAQGGPRIFPGAQWQTLGEVNIHQIGDPGALFNIYVGLLQQYADVTGVNAPRLGAQTVSHTTAFAKDVELARGQVRTVDYVKNTLKGPLTQWLNMAYVMGRENMRQTRLFIDEYGGFVDIQKKHTPDDVTFEAHGAGGPQEEQEKQQRRLAAAQFAIQLDQFAVQTGQEPMIDIAALQTQVLREGGWTDLDFITRGQGAVAGAANGLQMGTSDFLPGIASSDPTALE